MLLVGGAAMAAAATAGGDDDHRKVGTAQVAADTSSYVAVTVWVLGTTCRFMVRHA
jgi:hypothetical protein